MEESRLELWGLAILVVVFLLVGAPVLIAQVQGEDLLRMPGWLWWSGYVGYLLSFVATFWVPALRAVTPLRAVAAMVALGGVVVAAAPQSWTPVLLVFTTATAAHELSRRATTTVAMINTALLFAVLTGIGVPLWEAAFSAAMYAGLQALAVWATWLQRRESEARKRLAVVHTELRTATALLAETSRSAERLRISRDLHDVVGHQLTALTLELEVATHKAIPPASDHVQRARDLAKALLGDVRTAVGELRDRPADLHEALHELVADLPTPTIHLDVDDDLAVTGDVVATLVRCTQEIVTNTIRHAVDAYNLWIRVARTDDGEVVLTAHDDGQGTPVLHLGNGLTGMRERVAQFGGTVRFDAGTVRFEARDGFGVEVTIPHADELTEAPPATVPTTTSTTDTSTSTTVPTR